MKEQKVLFARANEGKRKPMEEIKRSGGKDIEETRQTGPGSGTRISKRKKREII